MAAWNWSFRTKDATDIHHPAFQLTGLTLSKMEFLLFREHHHPELLIEKLAKVCLRGGGKPWEASPASGLHEGRLNDEWPGWLSLGVAEIFMGNVCQHERRGRKDKGRDEHEDGQTLVICPYFSQSAEAVALFGYRGFL
jgi:hypothetical protein